MFIYADRCVDVIWNNFTALCRTFDSLNVSASNPVMFFWLCVQLTIRLKLWAGNTANAGGDQDAPPHYMDTEQNLFSDSYLPPSDFLQ